MSQSHERPLLVILPALNEEETVGEVVRAVPTEIRGIDRVEAVVVDAGSTDGTVAVARQAGARVVSQGKRLVRDA